MARKYKIKTKNKSFFSRLIPEPIQAFVARRIIDSTGFVIGCFGLFILASTASYHHSDPSWNTASTLNITQNWMGRSGANISDLLIQTLGLSGALIGVILTVWGLSIWRRRPLTPFWSRLVAMIVGVFMAAIALARIPSGGWLTQSYLGGSAGHLMFQNIADIFHSIGIGYEYILTPIILGALALIAIGYACAISRSEAKYISSIIWFGVSIVGISITNKAIGFYDWVRHYGDTNYQPKREKKKVSKPVISKPTPKVKSEVLKRTEPVMDSENATDSDIPVSNIKVVAPQEAGKTAGISQTRFQLFDGGEWELPALDLMQEVPADNDAEQMDENALRMNAELLQNVLEDFNVKGDIVSIHPGPVVTLYELEPAPGVKSSRVIGLADDIARSMSAVSVRAAVVPGRNVIGHP